MLVENFPTFFSSTYYHCSFLTRVHECLHRKLLSHGTFLPVCVQVAKAVSHSLNNCVNCLPGQKDVDVALKSIGESSKKLLVDSVRSLGLGRRLGLGHLRCEWHLFSTMGSLGS